MLKRYDKSLFIFRRDLRVLDNTGLIQALQQSHSVLPLFIFDDRQIGAANNYRSAHAIRFMIESLEDLALQLNKRNTTLYIMRGIAERVIEDILETERFDALFVNYDYTPFSATRDSAIERVCRSHKCDFNAYHDVLLHAPGEVVSKKGTPYTQFTAFFNAASRIPVLYPDKSHAGIFVKKVALAHVSLSTIKASLLSKIKRINSASIRLVGGRSTALSILAHIDLFRSYAKDHDFPSKDTTRLSPHLKFGTISIREAFHAIKDTLGISHPLIRQLYWRDFFYHLAYYMPHVFGHAGNKKYENMWWSANVEHFTAWCEGKTGFPIIDAGMRELNMTGFMHNRVRLLVASFLTKDLHIDWRWGECYFAQRLIDYDPCVNNGNWQWVASTGCSAQPYFRIFNPWLQQKKYDPSCLYVKKWVPELRDSSPSTIHTWHKDTSPTIPDYPRPIVNHETESAFAKEMYRKASRRP